MSTMTYIKNFLKDRYIASITPTSPVGVRRVCRKMDFNTGKVFVEYGPGTGVITRKIAKLAGPDAHIILIERNEAFCKILTREFANDGRVSVHHDDARNVIQVLESHGIDKADYVISGIPFSWLPNDVRDQLVGHTYQCLRSGGKFLAYQTFWQADQHLRDHMANHFDHVVDEFELINAPPMRVYEACKNGQNGSAAGANGNGQH